MTRPVADLYEVDTREFGPRQFSEENGQPFTGLAVETDLEDRVKQLH